MNKNDIYEEGELVDRKKFKKDLKKKSLKHKHKKSRSRSIHKRKIRESSRRSSSTVRIIHSDEENKISLNNINKYSTRKNKDSIVEYYINEDIQENDQIMNYDKEREERRKKLEEIRNKFKHNEVYELKEQEEADRLTNEEAEKLLKIIEEEREMILLKGGDKTPDMFVETPVEDGENKKILNLPVFESYEDTTGYYTPELGEIINEQYKVIGICGKGIFSTVVKVIDINTNLEYAIKIIRTLDIMLISGEKERSILKRLTKCENIIKLLNTFEYKRHICMVFELYEMNLRELIKQNKHISLDSIRIYAKQILLAFDVIHKNKLIHADFKPDNAVINKSLTQVKVCDFGSVLSLEEVAITSDLVSRFYRAPEIFLGCHYDTKIDIWSIGCTLYELYTGKILFPGRHNNEMLKLIMQVKGKIPSKILKRGQFSNLYFNDGDKFLSKEINNFDKKEYIKEIEIPINPSRDFNSLLKGPDENLALFKDFLEKCLHMDPNKRLSAIEALCHPFIMNIKY